MDKIKNFFKKDGCKEILKAREFSSKNPESSALNNAYDFLNENYPNIIKKYEKLVKDKNLSQKEEQIIFKDFVADWLKKQLDNCKEINVEEIFKKGGKTKTKTKPKTKPKIKFVKNKSKKLKNLKILSGVSVATGISGVTGATALAIQNKKLKNILTELQNQLSFYRKKEKEPSTLFSFFGKIKRHPDIVILDKELNDCKKAILQFKKENKKIIKENENIKKDIENIEHNFKSCNDKLKECNKNFLNSNIDQ